MQYKSEDRSAHLVELTAALLASGQYSRFAKPEEIVGHAEMIRKEIERKITDRE
jgi:hypothetical protein